MKHQRECRRLGAFVTERDERSFCDWRTAGTSTQTMRGRGIPPVRTLHTGRYELAPTTALRAHAQTDCSERFRAACRRRTGVISSRTVVLPITVPAGIGKVIAAPPRPPRVDAMAIAFAGVLLVLATCPVKVLGAQRSEAALPDHSIIHDGVIERIQSGDAHSPRAASRGWGRGLQLAALSIDSSKLGNHARKAVSKWPAAQKADPAWDWARVLVFLVQSALIVQGHDPGKLDGLMGPKTMLALLAWSAASGPSWDGDGDSTKAYRWGLDGNVAHLLHKTLEAQGLSPGPEDRFLGRESVTALERWDGTFRRGGLFMRVSEDIGRDIVMNELGAGGPSDSAEAAGRSTGRESAGRSRGRGYTEYACLKISWSEGVPACHSDGYSAAEGKCIWALDLDNSCSHYVVVYLLADRKNGSGPFWESGGVYDAGETREEIWDAELPEQLEPDIRYCAHKYDPEVRDWPYGVLVDSSGNGWYRNDFRDAQGEIRTNLDRAYANFVPNPTCMDTY